MERNILLRLEYDGSTFHGFQIQKNARTIQGVLEESLEKLTNEKIRIISASRTDAGVHALDHVVNFKTRTKLPVRAFLHGLNKHLPHSIRVQEARVVPLDFHAQKCAYKKEYAYFIMINKQHHVMNKYSWKIFTELEIESMKSCLTSLIGEHDFSSFRASSCDSVSPVRTIYKAKISRLRHPILTHLPFFKITIVGNGFLKHMVRNIMGTLIDVGIKKNSFNDFKKIVASRDRTKAGMTAPSEGLFLMKTWIRLT
jgi:tRNA pseudouridine38-40 synthase